MWDDKNSYFAHIPFIGYGRIVVTGVIISFSQLLFQVAFATTFFFGFSAVFAEVGGYVVFVAIVPNNNAQLYEALVREA